jgi:pimeloyl-ACP methyl ester carboxylesterase
MKIKVAIVTLLVLVYACVHPVLSIAQPGQVQANGITISYENFGPKEGETILLISGTNAQLTMWPVEFCNGLVKHGYRVIRFDNRDIGLSTKFDEAGMPDWAAISKAIQEKKTPPLPYTLDDMANDAVGLLDALGIKKAHIVGASMGAMIAQRVAYNHPEQTLSLASISAGGGNATFPLVAKPDVVSKLPPPGNPSDTADYIKREIQARTLLAGNVYPPDQKKLVEEIKADVARSYYPDGLMRQGAVSMAGFYAGRQEQLKTIKVPAIVIHGDQDPLVVIDAGKDVASNIPGADFEIIKGMGHYLSEPLINTLVDLIVKNAAKAKESNE